MRFANNEEATRGTLFIHCGGYTKPYTVEYYIVVSKCFAQARFDIRLQHPIQLRTRDSGHLQYLECRPARHGKDSAEDRPGLQGMR